MIRSRAMGATGLMAASLLFLASPSPALAHHSFAVFFSSDKDVVSVKGTVQTYRFTNPHGVIDLVVTTPDGRQENWRVETNSPSILVRRGWTKDSIVPGEVITVQGWLARDGSKYMRLRGAFRANGAPIGNLGRTDGGAP
jgi:hypothetical protein